MRILLLCHGLPPDSQGGVQQHVLGLAAALVAEGHAVHLYVRAMQPGMAQGESTTAPGNPAITTTAYRWEGVDSLGAMYDCRPMADALQRFLAERTAAGERFDVAHVHHLTGMSTDSVAVLKQAGVPVVMTLHDYWLFCPRGQMFHKREEVCASAPVDRCAQCLQATFPWWLDERTRDDRVRALHGRARDVMLLADRLVVPSARTIPHFAALGVPAERFTEVENGVDTDALLAMPPLVPHAGPLRLGYLGTLMASKGLHVAIEAVQRQAPGAVSLAIHGNAVPYHGDETYLNRCFQRLRPGDPIAYHGPYGLGELAERLADIDVLLAPALWNEAFGLTVREALAAGRPVLVSRVGGLQDAVADGEQGFVLPPADVDAWAKAVARLAGDRGAVLAMGRKARSRARSFADMAAQLVGIYEGIRPRT